RRRQIRVVDGERAVLLELQADRGERFISLVAGIRITQLGLQVAHDLAQRRVPGQYAGRVPGLIERKLFFSEISPSNVSASEIAEALFDGGEVGTDVKIVCVVGILRQQRQCDPLQGRAHRVGGAADGDAVYL